MEQDAPNSIRPYWLCLPLVQKEQLAKLRTWSELKMGQDADFCWVKNLSKKQVESSMVKSMLAALVYEEKEGMLFKQNSLLPARRPPSLLWTSIQRALPIEIVKSSNASVEAQQGIKVSLLPSEKPQKAFAMLCELPLLEKYLMEAPAVRLAALSWVCLLPSHALLMGEALLPLPGKVFWRKGNSLMPAGYDWEFSGLLPAFEKKANPEESNWLLWNEEASFLPIPKEAFSPLSRRSFVKTLEMAKNGA